MEESLRGIRADREVLVDQGAIETARLAFAEDGGEHVERRVEVVVEGTLDLVARVGGDEFAMLLEPVADRQYVDDVRARLITLIEGPIMVGDTRVSVGCSVGVSWFPEHGRESRELTSHADLALIKAERGDRWGNLTYRMAARNFGPVMAMAARRTVASVHEIVPLGALDPESIVTPGIFVHRIVQVARAPTPAGGARPEAGS